MSYLERPRSVWWRRVVFQVHLWLGVVSALYLVVVSVTGAALVFRIHLQRAVHPELLSASPGPLADIATVLDRVRAAYPDGRVVGADAPTEVRPTYLAYVTQDDRFHTVLIDAATADIRGELPEHSIVRTLQDLHFDLLAGPRGRLVNGVGALCLLLLCATGLVVWWPGLGRWPRALGVEWHRPWPRVLWDVHGAVGVWTVLAIAMWAVTGVYFAFPSEFRAAVDAVSPLSTVSVPRSVPSSAVTARPTWRELVDVARRREPEAFVARVVVPADDTAPFHVLFADRRPTPLGPGRLRAVYLDQFSGRRLPAPPRSAATLGDVVMAWVAPLHVGSFGGLGVRLVWLVFGLAPAVLAATGLIVWWHRVVWSRRGRVVVATGPAASSLTDIGTGDAAQAGRPPWIAVETARSTAPEDESAA